MDFISIDSLPDYSPMNKFRNLLIQKRRLKKIFKLLNLQLEELGLSINNAKSAIVDPTLIESLGRLNKYLDIYAQMIEKN